MSETQNTCFRCGICCRRYQVRLSLTEARRIAHELGMSWDDFASQYLDKRWPGTKSLLLRQSHGACPFLEQEEDSAIASCRIHAFRPSSCREWAPGVHRPECQQGLAQYWGLRVDAQGKLKGTALKQQRFQAFLESLDSQGDSTL